MTFFDTIYNYAQEAHSFFQGEWDHDGDRQHNIDEAIQDLYKRGELEEIFPSLKELTESRYYLEVTYINDFRDSIATNIDVLLNN